MFKIRYSLDSELDNGITDIKPPKELNVQVRNLVIKAKKGGKLTKGEIIAEPPASLRGAQHAAACGKVTAVNYHSLTVKCSGEEATVEPVDVRSMNPGSELPRALRALGVDVSQLSGKADTLVINGLNPEPGVSVAQQILRDGREELNEGLSLARKLVSPVRTFLAVSQGTNITLPGAETVGLKARYPYSLDPLVVRAVTGTELPEYTRIISVMDLYALGRVAMTGLPVTNTIMTIAGRNYRVPVGTTIRHLLDVLNITVESGDTVVLGGPFRGEAVYSLYDGVKKGDYGLFVTSSKAIPAVQDAACINCGECVLQCPARVQPHLISRCAEYELFDQAEKYGLNSCFECGLCAFNCFARRPLLQYIRFAKAQIRAKAEVAQA